MAELTGADMATAGDALSRMLIQGQQAQALMVAAQLGIAALLVEGPRVSREVRHDY